jgi:cell wall-associated NlpC family hydrolase
MRRLPFYSMMAVLSLSACTSLKNMSAKDFSNNNSNTRSSFVSTKTEKQTRFIENISIIPSLSSSASVASSSNELVDNYSYLPNGPAATSSAPSIESCNYLQFKYAILLNDDIETLTNFALLQQMDKWMGTRYCYGGTGLNGRCIDCSAFTGVMLKSVWNIDLPRTAHAQYAASQHISRAELREGDLIFFNTTGGISHVAVYLRNNKFIHASSSSGVMISDLSDTYWASRFRGCGRVIEQ